jgi:hypothetical protein
MARRTPLARASECPSLVNAPPRLRTPERIDKVIRMVRMPSPWLRISGHFCAESANPYQPWGGIGLALGFAVACEGWWSGSAGGGRKR